MSDNQETTAGTVPARKMVSVNGKELGGKKEYENQLVFKKPKGMTEADIGQIIAAGIYTGKRLYTFDNGDTREDFLILDAVAKVEVSLAPNATLTNQFSKIPEGTYVEVTYLGSEVMTKGKGAGKTTHKFVVGREA